jgi:hypothetical protein
MEELSKQLSVELNEPITIHQVEGTWIEFDEGYGNSYKMDTYVSIERFYANNINKNELFLWLVGTNIQIICNSKCDITTIIQMYNQTKHYKNNLNKEFNLDCAMQTFYDDNNLIDEVVIQISQYDLGKYIRPVYAKTNLECYEKINKIITLKNELLSNYETIGESDYESQFVLNIDNNDIITLQYTLYNEDICYEHENIRLRITIDTNKLLIYDVYNQFRNYINSFIEKYDKDDCFQYLYCEIHTIYIDMSYKDNKSNIDVKISNKNDNYHITINSESRNLDFKVITEIYNEFINYIETCYLTIGHKNNKFTEFNLIYNSSDLVNICAKYNMNNICANNYIEFTEKLEEHRLKEEQEKFTTKLKLKYGETTVLSNSYHYTPSSIYLIISNADTEYIDLLDIIHNYSGNRIVNGFIKQTNCANYEKYINSNSTIDKHIFNITIQNCPNLKIINNIIDFENNAHLKICNCPKLEFIQNYNNFSEIYIDNHKVKIFNE